MKDSPFSYAVFIITIVVTVILLLSGCVSPSKYDVELANKQHDNMLTMMDLIEDQEDMLFGFMLILEKRITMLEQGRMYMVAPNTSFVDVCPQYLEPIEESGTGG